MTDALLTLPAAADRLSISRRALEREIAAGRIAVARWLAGEASLLKSHANLAVTSRYAHLATDHLKEAARAAGRKNGNGAKTGQE